MAKLIWDRDGERLYETGVCHVVLYPKNTIVTPFGQTLNRYGPGVAWNGVTSISVSPSGGEAQPVWADDLKYLNLVSAEDLSLTIEAYTYPDEFKACDGIFEPVPGVSVFAQKRREFALSFETTVGNDLLGLDYGKKLHMIYGCRVQPAERGHQTISDSPEPTTMSWTVSTTPKTMANGLRTAYLVLDSSKTGGISYAAIERILQGDDGVIDGFIFDDYGYTPELPYPDELTGYLQSAQEAESTGRPTGFSVVYSSRDNGIRAIREDLSGRYLY